MSDSPVHLNLPIDLCFCVSVAGDQEVLPFMFRQRLQVEPGASVDCCMSNSCPLKNRSWKHESPGTVYSLAIYLAIQIAKHVREKRKDIHLKPLSELSKWAPELTQHPGHPQRTWFQSIKILPLIGRKITHSWVMKSHLCSATSQSHLIPLYLLKLFCYFKILCKIWKSKGREVWMESYNSEHCVASRFQTLLEGQYWFITPWLLRCSVRYRASYIFCTGNTQKGI